jgi:hypothetical protein
LGSLLPHDNLRALGWPAKPIGAGQKFPQTNLLTPWAALNTLAYVLGESETNSPSPRRRSVRAGAQKPIFYQYLSGTNWIPVGSSPADDGINKTVIVNPPLGRQFYRLILP